VTVSQLRLMRTPRLSPAHIALSIGWIGIGAIKLIGRDPHAWHHLAAPSAVRDWMPTLIDSAAAVEVVLGVALLSPLAPAAALGSLTWTAALSGAATALTIVGVPLEKCGCAGPFEISPVGHVLVLVGLTFLSVQCCTIGGRLPGERMP
jgi:hypothetical protein